MKKPPVTAITDGRPLTNVNRKDVIIIPRKETQCKMILEHLKTFNSITPLEALELYQCMRLSGRIKELRNQGYLIETDVVRNNGKWFAKYVWKGHKNGQL